MVTVSKNSLIVAGLLCVIAGWTMHDSYAPSPNTDRPVLRALAKLAKTALWFAAFAEPAPANQNVEVQSVLVDENGYAHLNHARGW